jgi:ribosomal 30S subunit maturation factor RimM
MLEIGRLVKPHGLRGDIIVSLVTNRPERLAPGSVLNTDAGELACKPSSRRTRPG